VDLTLYEIGTGQPVTMPSGYDDSRRAYPDYGGTSRQRWLQDLLRRAMEARVPRVQYEWWHFDFGVGRYPILNLALESLGECEDVGEREDVKRPELIRAGVW
jgi:D-alanyl-D-alanine dipeptidase